MLCLLFLSVNGIVILTQKVFKMTLGKNAPLERLGLRYLAALRRELLLDLANLPDDRCAPFRRRYRALLGLPDSDARLLRYRDQLRHLWVNIHDASLARWVEDVHESRERVWLLGYLRGAPYVNPNYFLFPLALSSGATELTAKMAVCANPKCPEPYFLKNRGTQRFCDRRACLAYGQRQHKLRWWQKHEAEQLKAKKAKKRKKPRRRRERRA